MSDILKKYSIVIGADTKELMTELNKVEKELTDKLDNKDLGAGVRSSIDKLIQEVKTMQSELRTATRDINKGINAINADALKGKFEGLQKVISSDLKSLTESIEKVQSSISLLSQSDFSGLETGIRKSLDSIDKKMQSIEERFQLFQAVFKDHGAVIDVSHMAKGLEDADKTIQDETKKLRTSLNRLFDSYNDKQINLNKIITGEIDLDINSALEIFSLLKNIIDTANQLDNASVSDVISKNFNGRFNIDTIKKQFKSLDELISDELSDTKSKLGKEQDIYLRWKTEISDDSTVEKLNEKIDNYQKSVQEHIDKKPLNFKTDIDKKDFENVVKNAIKEENDLLKAPEAPKIKVGLEIGELKKGEMQNVSEDISANINGKITGNIDASGGSFNVESSNLAQESTLSEIKDILANWNGNNNVHSISDNKKSQEYERDIKSAYNLVKSWKFNGAGIAEENKADLRKSLLSKYEYDFARKLAYGEITRKNKNIFSNPENIKNTKLWNDVVTVDGIDYAKWDTKNRTIDEFREFLSSVIEKQEESFFKEEKKRIEKVLNAQKENLKLVDVEYDKDGKILQRSSLAIGKKEIYSATNNKVNQARQRILGGYTDDSGNYHEGLDTEYKQLQILEQRRTLMQEIVLLADKENLSDEDQKSLYSKQEQLKALTRICDNEKLYYDLISERASIEEKIKKGTAKYEDIERIGVIAKQTDEMWHDVSDNMIEYSRANIKLIDSEVDEQYSKVNKLKKEFRNQVGKIYDDTRKVRIDKGSNKDGAIIDETFLNINNDKDFEFAKKQYKSLIEELAVLRRGVSFDKNGKEDLSTLTQSEKERYYALEKSTYQLKTQLELYANLAGKEQKDLEISRDKSKVQSLLASYYEKSNGYHNELLSDKELEDFSEKLNKMAEEASDSVEISKEQIIKEYIDERISYLKNNLDYINKQIEERVQRGIPAEFLTEKSKQVKSDIDSLEASKAQSSIQDNIINSIKTENKLDDETILKVREILDLTVQIEESKKRINEIDNKADFKIGKRDQKKYDELISQLNNDSKYDKNQTNRERLRLNHLNSVVKSLEIEKLNKRTSSSRVAEIDRELQNAKSEIENISLIYGEYLSIEDQISNIIKRNSTKSKSSLKGMDSWRSSLGKEEILQNDLNIQRQLLINNLKSNGLDKNIINQLETLSGSSLDDITSKVIKEYIESRLSSSEFNKTLFSIIESKKSQSSDKELVLSIKSEIDKEIERRLEIREASEKSRQEAEIQKQAEEKKNNRSASTKNREINKKYDSKIAELENSINEQNKVVDEAKNNLEAAINAQKKANESIQKYKKFNDFETQIMYYETLRDSKLQEVSSAQNAVVETKDRIDKLTKTLQDKSFINGQTENSVKIALDNAKTELEKQEYDLIELETKTSADIELYNKEIEKLIIKRGVSKTKNPYTGIDFSKIYNQSDLNAFKAYNEERMKGTSLNEITVFYRTMSGASERAQEFVRNLNGKLVDLNQIINVDNIDKKQLADNAIEFVKRGGKFSQLPQEITSIISSYIKSVQEQANNSVQQARSVYDSANAQLKQSNNTLDNLNKSKEAEKDAVKLYEEERKYIQSLKEQFKIANTSKSKREVTSDLFSYNSRNSITKGMSDEQKYASFKVDYQLNEVTKLLAEQEKLRSTVGETSEEYKQNADKIQQAKKYLTDFRNEAVELGLTISQTTGRAVLDMSKESVSLGKNIFTGVSEHYARTKEQLAEFRAENARIAEENQKAKEKEQELAEKVAIARMGVAKAEGTEASAKKELTKAEKFTVNMTKEELELRQRLNNEQIKLFNLKRNKASKEELETQERIVDEVKKQVELSERLDLVKVKGKYYANLKNEYLPKDAGSKNNTSSNSSNYSSTAPATEGTLSQIRDILVNNLNKKSSDSKTKNSSNKENNKGKFNQEEYLKIAKELGVKTAVSKRTGNEYVVNKSDKRKVYSEMEKRGISRYLEEENKALDDNTKKTDKNTESKKRNSEETKKVKNAKKEDIQVSQEQEVTDEQVAKALENLIGQVTLLEERLSKLDKKSAEYKEVSDSLQKAKDGINILEGNSKDSHETKKQNDVVKKETKAKKEHKNNKSDNLYEPTIDGVPASSIGKLAQYPNELLKAYLDGVEASTPEMEEAWKVLAQIPEDIIREVLKIESPSKVMEELGYWTDAGFVKGIKENSDDIKQALMDAFIHAKVSQSEIVTWLNLDSTKSLIGKQGNNNIYKSLKDLLSTNQIPESYTKTINLSDAKKLIPKGLKISDDELRQLGTKIKGQWQIAEDAVQEYIKKKQEALSLGEDNVKDIDVDKLYNRYRKALKDKNSATVAIENGNISNANYAKRANAEKIILDCEEKIFRLKKQSVDLDSKDNEIESFKQELANNLLSTKLSIFEVDLDSLQNGEKFNSGYEKQINVLSEKLVKFRNLADATSLSSKDANVFKTLKSEISDLITELNKIKEIPDLEITDYANLENSGEIANILHNLSGIQKESVKIYDSGKKIVGTIKESGGQTKTLEYTWNNVLKAFVKSTSVISTQLSLWDRIKGQISKSANYFKSYFSGYMVTQKVIAEFRKGFEYIKELDSALTEMKKVSDESTESLKRFQRQSFDMAKQIGTTAVEIQKSAADFMRLGYNLSEASQLAKDANIYANVGDMDISTATEHMISSIKAWESEFGSSVEASTALIDKYNEIGNNFAITSADIGSAMERSAAALKVAGNTLDESIGLITAGNLIQQDADTTANALKVMSLRIRGSKTDLEEMGEEVDDLASSTSKLREEIKALTGVDIMENDTTYKSTAKIIQEIGANWDKLEDVSKSSALEKLAGKTRASTVAGLLENYKVIAEVVESSEKAQGSAMRENLEYIDSIEGRVNQLNSEIQRFWNNLISSDFVKNAISGLTDILGLLSSIVDKIGVLGTTLVGGGAFAAFKNFGRPKMCGLKIKCFECRNVYVSTGYCSLNILNREIHED